jgi:hypothetical protein
MLIQILLRQINIGFFLMVAARSIILAIFISAATSSMMIDCFNGCACAYRLDIVAQIKIMRESSLIFLDLWFVIYFWLPPEKYKIVLWKKKEFEDLKVLLVFFGFYFIIVKISSCISTMYSLRSQI